MIGNGSKNSSDLTVKERSYNDRVCAKLSELSEVVVHIRARCRDISGYDCPDCTAEISKAENIYDTYIERLDCILSNAYSAREYLIKVTGE